MGSSSLQLLWENETWGVKQSAGVKGERNVGSSSLQVFWENETWGQAVCRCCGRTKHGVKQSAGVLGE
jgi:hypothetical protein